MNHAKAFLNAPGAFHSPMKPTENSCVGAEGPSDIAGLVKPGSPPEYRTTNASHITDRKRGVKDRYALHAVYNHTHIIGRLRCIEHERTAPLFLLLCELLLNEERPQMRQLPRARDPQHQQLNKCPPHHPSIRRLGLISKLRFSLL